MLGIVLGAGLGERMGGRKARLLVDGVPLATLHAARLIAAGASTVAVVLRPDDLGLIAVPSSVTDDGVTTLAARTLAVASAEPDQAGSLARAIDALAPAPDDILVVTPVDALPASAETIRTLARALDDGFDAAVPTFGDRGGHPIVVRAAVLLGGRGRPLRDVLAALGDRRARIAVDDAAVATDLDTPEAVLRALGAPPRFV